jgi:hypothetical protein
VPYFVYRIRSTGVVRALEALGSHEKFGPAREKVRALRSSADPAEGEVRMVFAENALRAEELLAEVRAPEPMVGDDY